MLKLERGGVREVYFPFLYERKLKIKKTGVIDETPIKDGLVIQLYRTEKNVTSINPGFYVYVIQDGAIIEKKYFSFQDKEEAQGFYMKTVDEYLERLTK